MWGCRQNAIRLEENENREKEIRNQIVEEGEEFKKAFYEKRKVNIETNKTNNRDKENVRLLGIALDPQYSSYKIACFSKFDFLFPLLLLFLVAVVLN